MTKNDIQAVQKITTESWRMFYKNIIPLSTQNDFLASAYNERVLIGRMENSSFYVAEENGEVIGFANFSRVKSSGEVELHAIYVLESKLNKGIGSMLMDEGIRQLKPNKIQVSVETLNKVALDFYLARNFVIEDEYDALFSQHILRRTRLSLDVEESTV